MVYKGDAFKGKIQFVTSAEMPHLIYQACVKTGAYPSVSVYCQYALADALSRDLGIPVDDIIKNLPPPMTRSAVLMDPRDPKTHRAPDTIEEVR